jgi:sulfur carrier protein ThiS
MEETPTSTSSVAMLTLQCRLVGELRRYLPEGNRGEGSVELAGPATIENLLIQLEIPERELLVVGVNGTKAPHTDPLSDGDEVTIVAPMTGGASTSGDAPQDDDRKRRSTYREATKYG